MNIKLCKYPVNGSTYICVCLYTPISAARHGQMCTQI